MGWIALVILAALVEYYVLGLMVGRYRRKEVPAPAMTGPPRFERTLRAQLNTMERLVLFVPAVVLFGQFTSELWGAILGAVWVLGRALYAAGYIRAAEKRTAGSLVAGLAEIALLIGALVGVIRALL